MEARLQESGRSVDQASAEELESLWQQAKVEEKKIEEKKIEEKKIEEKKSAEETGSSGSRERSA
jgi:hypothetical protein